MAKTAKTHAANIAKAWRHSVQRSDDSEGARPAVNMRRTPKIRSSEAKRTGTYAGPGWRKVPSGRWRLSQITSSANSARMLAEARSVVIVRTDSNKIAARPPENF